MIENPLYLYVDSVKNIWYCNEKSKPVCLHTNLEHIYKHSKLSGNYFRFAGLPNNFPLIAALYERKVKRNNGRVEICSPQVFRSHSESSVPSSLLVLQHEASVNCYGGWRELRNLEYSTIQLALATGIHAKELNIPRIENLLRAHPIWPELAFIPNLNFVPCAHMLSIILDPRWYVDPLHPSRGSKLRNYLGLSPRSIKKLDDNSQKLDIYDWRCRIVTSSLTWTSDSDCFIYNTFNKLKKHDVLKAMLRASQLFVEYVRLVWLSVLGSGAHQKESLFIPKYFFKLDDDAVNFQNCVRRIRGAT